MIEVRLNRGGKVWLWRKGKADDSREPLRIKPPKPLFSIQNITKGASHGRIRKDVWV